MTIRDSVRGGVGRVVAGSLAFMVIGVGIVACGQRGPLRLPDAAFAARPSAPVAVPRGDSAASAPDGRDPFSNPPPTAAPAPVPRP